MSSLSTTFRSLAVAAFAVFASSCADSPTGPRSGTPVGTIRLSDTLFTRSAVIRAGIDVPAGYALRSGSVRWTVASGTATVSEVAGASDSVDVSLTATGGVTLRATYTLTSADENARLRCRIGLTFDPSQLQWADTSRPVRVRSGD